MIVASRAEIPVRLRAAPLLSLLLLLGVPVIAQTTKNLCVRDPSGQAVAGAIVSAGDKRLGITAVDGCVALDGAAASVNITAAGFADAVTTTAGAMTIIELQIAASRQQVTVTATRTPLALDATASDVAVLSASQLAQAPGFALDDQLRQVSGFQLYRRTSSWASNPTSQGVSLRGLGSTAASRTLVLSDEVPYADPIGGWVRWNEIPELAVSQVEVLRGGASDLYGSSAIGGVIQIVPVQPTATGYAIDAYGGGLGTYSVNALGSKVIGPWQGLLAASDFHTDGYIPVPEPYRGTVDADSNDHAQSGRVELRYSTGEATNIFALGNVLNDTRQNGTVLQNNAGRIWRYATGGNWDRPVAGQINVRVYGAQEDYRQSFSAVSADRDEETLTRLQRVPSEEIGGGAQWAKSYPHAVTLVGGADVLDIRANDNETPVHAGVDQPTQSTTARQRATGVYGEILFAPRGWSIALSSRLDRFSTFDAHTTVGGTPGEKPLPSIGETVLDPHIGIVREAGKYLSFTGSAFRAFRGPTFNELYRTGQVGDETTLPNPTLKSERATGFEFAALVSMRRAGSLRGGYFWTEVNRPITALLISETSSSILEMRENLGQLRSRGLAVEYQAAPVSWAQINAGYQYAKATVTAFAPDPTLVGLWIPEVPRNMFSGNVALDPHGWGTLNLIAYISGRQYDDSQNQYLLHSYSRFDVEYSHTLTHHWDAYVSVQNLLNRSIEVAKTPVLSLGTPQLLVVGIRRVVWKDGH